MSGFQMVQYSNARDRHKIESEYQRRFGIRMLTVFDIRTEYPDIEYIYNKMAAKVGRISKIREVTKSTFR
jgi:hypothetical protein